MTSITSFSILMDRKLGYTPSIEATSSLVHASASR